jgi:hypothetical protein
VLIPLEVLAADDAEVDTNTADVQAVETRPDVNATHGVRAMSMHGLRSSLSSYQSNLMNHLI